VVFIQEQSTMINLMGKEFFGLRMGRFYIKDLGLMVQEMGLDVTFIQMDLNMKEIGCITSNMGKELTQIV
jgi:hypothetical protein